MWTFPYRIAEKECFYKTSPPHHAAWRGGTASMTVFTSVSLIHLSLLLMKAVDRVFTNIFVLKRSIHCKRKCIRRIIRLRDRREVQHPQEHLLDLSLICFSISRDHRLQLQGSRFDRRNTMFSERQKNYAAGLRNIHGRPDIRFKEQALDNSQLWFCLCEEFTEIMMDFLQAIGGWQPGFRGDRQPLDTGNVMDGL